MIELTSVGYEHEALKEKALELSKQLNLELEKESPLCLFYTDLGLSIKTPSFTPLYVDFSEQTVKKRRAEGKKQGLISACKPRPGIRIIDATAGWGRDASLLAAFGAKVLMIERNRSMAALLDDALKRRSLKEQENMDLSLYHGDAFAYFKNLVQEEYPDIIYIDPMHPQRTKAALVKKDMQILQNLIGPDEDALSLIELAITRVKKCVVVKWPQKVKPLISTPHCVKGKTVRFDVYT